MSKDTYHKVLWSQLAEASRNLYLAGYDAEEILHKTHLAIVEAIEEETFSELENDDDE